MALHRIKQGLDLPISGSPEQVVEDGPPVARVGIIASDYVGMKPRWEIQEGDTVKRGELLFEDRKNAGVRFTSLAAGTVVAVNLGAKRALQSVVIELNDREKNGETTAEDHVAFEAFTGESVDELDGGVVKALLTESGAWTALRTRPFNKVPAVDGKAHSIFVTAIDTEPLSVDVEIALAGRMDDFQEGLAVLQHLTDGQVFLCRAPASAISGGSLPRVRIEEFEGPHPAGLAGTHIHTLDPVSRGKTVWHVGYNDVADFGELFRTGRLAAERVISLGGPAVEQPRLLRTRTGAHIGTLVAGQIADGDVRVISGSVLSGTTANGDTLGYLGRYARQVTVLLEGRTREFMGWLLPGFNIFSVVPTFMSALFKESDQRFDMTTDTMGSDRAMVPIGTYEEVMPLDIVPTYLLRSMVAGDLEKAEQLGCLELAEEDLALCTVVCPGKYDYGPILRETLSTIEAEG
jgi:Na+-transporting NADH:ubiquinone oxidoreductase subunit A